MKIELDSELVAEVLLVLNDHLVSSRSPQSEAVYQRLMLRVKYQIRGKFRFQMPYYGSRVLHCANNLLLVDRPLDSPCTLFYFDGHIAGKVEGWARENVIVDPKVPASWYGYQFYPNPDRLLIPGDVVYDADQLLVPGDVLTRLRKFNP